MGNRGTHPSHDEARSAFLVPLRVALAVLFLWGAAAALWTIIYGLANRLFIPRFLFSMGVIGVVAATSCYLLTEFALRPMAAQALEVGATPRSLVRGIVGRTMLVWLLCSGVPTSVSPSPPSSTIRFGNSPMINS